MAVTVTHPLSVPPSPQRRSNSRGAALFIAIAMLALFSLLGVSYVRFLMVEEDLATLEMRKLRAQYYAEAGIHCASAYLQEILEKESIPVSSTTYTFPVYGLLQGRASDRPALLTQYRADVAVTIASISAADWEMNPLFSGSYPGDGLVWAVESSAVLLKTNTPTERPLSRHTLASVLSVSHDQIQTLSWHTSR